MQVYREMDIGTAKPTPAERDEVRHHMIDVADPAEDYTVARFAAEVNAALDEVRSRGATPVLVGGTGLYLRAVIDDLEIPGRYPQVVAELDTEPDTRALHARLAGLDPVAATRMEPTNRRRVLRALEVTLGSGRPFSSHGPGLDTHRPSPFRLVGVRMARPVVDDRIAARYRRQLDDGFCDEVRRLRDRPGGLGRTARQALGYRELLEHLEGRTTLEEALGAAIANTRRFARRQERWFRRDPRIRWLDVEHDPLAVLDDLLGEFDSCT